MTVYVDNLNARFKHYTMCHMMADTEEELLDMALKIGMDPKWWQYKGTRKSHFDISLSMKDKALALGAVHVSWPELGYMLLGRHGCDEPLRTPRKVISSNQL